MNCAAFFRSRGSHSALCLSLAVASAIALPSASARAQTLANRTTLRPAGRAYREVATWLVGRVMTSLAVDASGSYRATLRGRDGRLARILWNPNDRPLFTVPGAWGATEVRDLEGGIRPIGASLEITDSPILVQ